MQQNMIKVLEGIKNHQSLSYSDFNLTKNEFGDVVQMIKSQKYANNVYVRKIDDVYTMIDISEGDLTSKGYHFLAESLDFNVTDKL